MPKRRGSGIVVLRKTVPGLNKESVNIAAKRRIRRTDWLLNGVPNAPLHWTDPPWNPVRGVQVNLYIELINFSIDRTTR